MKRFQETYNARTYLTRFRPWITWCVMPRRHVTYVGKRVSLNLHAKHVGQDTGQTTLYQKGVTAQHRAAHYVDPAITGLSGSVENGRGRQTPQTHSHTTVSFLKTSPSTIIKTCQPQPYVCVCVRASCKRGSCGMQ